MKTHVNQDEVLGETKPDLGLLTSKTLKQWLSVVLVTQSLVLCCGILTKEMQLMLIIYFSKVVKC
jgi:hypothetical protein